MPSPSRLPPWLTVLTRRQINPNRGIPLRRSALGRLPSSLSNDDIGGRRRSSSSRGGKGKNEEKTPEAVLNKLRDYGLSEDQISKVVNDDKRDSFDPLSPSDWLKGGGDALSTVLDKLDAPRAYLLSGLMEAHDAFGEAGEAIGLGEANPLKETERVKQSGVSWRDFIENAQNRVGFADVLEANPDEDVFGVSTKNPVVRAGLGFAVDVASDPLNYLGVGLADDAPKVAALFRDPGAIAALGKAGADDAAERVLQKGVTSLAEDELAAIGRKGGLYFKTPGTGAIGRTLRLNKLAGNPERYTTLARKGAKLGDLAQGAAQLTRRASGLNWAMRRIGGGAAARGLAGNLGPLRAAMRGANDIAKPLDALVTLRADSQGRGVANAFKARMMNEYKRLLSSARAAGVNGEDLFNAIGAGNPTGDPVVQMFADFLEVARTEANKLAGREFIPAQANYVPRVWTDEARERFGVAQARGRGGTRSMPRGRKYVARTSPKIGKNVYDLLDPLDPASGGLSVEQQIENALAAEGMTNWFKSDALDVVPDYIEKLSRQLKDEYMGSELKRLGVAEDMWIERDDVPFKSTPSAPGWAAVSKIEREVKFAEDVVRTFGADSALAKSLNWSDLFAKAKSVGAKWEAETGPALNDLLKATGEKWAQFGTAAALPADIVPILRDVGRMAEPGAFPKVMAIHDRLLNGWKKLALLTPGYHWRNSFGGVFMNWLADVDEGRYAQLERLIANDADAAPFFRQTKTVTRSAPAINDPELVAAYDEAKRLGVFGGGQSLDEIEQSVDSRNPLSRLSPIRASRKLGGAIENRLRGALFIDEYIKNGGDSASALEKMYKYHFDYQALGTGPHRLNEASIRRLGIPFYTFTRRSIPLMLEMIVRNPGKINRYFQAKDNIERMSEEEGIVPEYFTRNFAIRMPWTDDGNQTYLMPDLPIFSLIEGSDPNQALGQVSPFIKTPFELGTGQQVWKGIPLENRPVEIPTAVGFLTPALRAMGRTRTDAEGNERMSDRDLYAIMQALPQIGQFRRLFPSEDKYEERRMTSVLSFLFGVGSRTNTEQEQYNELWNRYDPYSDDIDENRELGFDADEARDMAFE